ncbi:hypothetical protein D6D01_08932 [Aureobasidium pullulans]|uniref:Cryptic loci regulator 2 N-terminal domain-containing protein n=1 Tax=Aureobasidium pullulans TaxID=5580 RepID=A0A4V6TEF5_AURPU|nr:hypothetical protein D6D01_08932 [Aureobasidium pullulans]
MAEQQTTFAAWHHECILGQPCTSFVHEFGASTAIPYPDVLQDDDDDDDEELQADEFEVEEATVDENDDHRTLRLDLLDNSDGDEAWRPAPKEGEDEAELANLEHTIKFLKNIESTFTAPFRILVNPTDHTASFPKDYVLTHKMRPSDPNHPGDSHLWGHPSGQVFRSAKSFAVHLHWLIKGSNDGCECLCCKKVDPAGKGQKVKDKKSKPSKKSKKGKKNKN